MAQRKMLFAYIGRDNSGENFYQNNYTSLCEKFPVTDIIICHNKRSDQIGAHTTAGYDKIINGEPGHTDVSLVACTDVLALKEIPFYVALPQVDTSTKGGTGNYSSEYKNFGTYLDKVEAALTQNKSWELCKGFYCPNEIIAGTVSQNSIMSNTYVKLLNDIAYKIRSEYGREFIWAPYLGYNSSFMDINSDNGIVANRTNIFDMVLFQPHTYFAPAGADWNPNNYNGTPPENSFLAAKCAIENVAYTYAAKNDRDHYKIVAGSKTSPTKIGVDVELDHNLVQNHNPEYIASYNKQCEGLEGVVGSDAPLVFYCGSGKTQLDAADAINQFFKDGTSIF